ncbi:hypothetical protein N9D31_03125 [Oligoflexaceae bacterium]|nr:hypothetical protein [Oligoflexaceae bacterium]
MQRRFGSARRFLLNYRAKSGSLPIKLGWIPYWNLRPLRIEIQKSAGGSLEWIKGHPTKVNRLMREDEILAAPCSSVNLLLSQNLFMALPLGVACDGNVDSVYLGIKNEVSSVSNYVNSRSTQLKEIVSTAVNQSFGDLRVAGDRIWQQTERSEFKPTSKTPQIKFSKRSATGNTLAKLFFRLNFGDESYLRATDQKITVDTESKSMQYELLIGDEALKKRSEFEHIVDLGQWWKNVTGLPFVYAVWQRGQHTLSPARKKLIFEAASLAQAKMHVDPTDYYLAECPVDTNGDQISLDNYWRKIRYRLHDLDFKALALFLSLSRNALHCNLEDSFIVRMNRWDEFRQTLS